ncbi:hypothetical protein C8A05DRAFT_34212 [Staphylotrichum tortipilum]|uniref:tRNA(Ile)-lysidine synthetase n=1 Tax=Staphylotrichum tortipilum TaxID=2831512 RepID=A0AAN6MKB6_9PEZI|nr:hypothetical protein C8A05DRAFT_34212 [Staphylotrichum longicolle]
MSTIPPVLHRSARAITPHEFLEVLHATCGPRFPQARSRTHRPIAIAISGGVDSMALAYLSAKIRPTEQWFKVADHPVSSTIGAVVDHGLREGSGEEAREVAVAISKLGVKPQVLRLRWDGLLPHPDAKPADLPNAETLARHLRYRRLGGLCKTWGVHALFTAHHEDDQYETVVMRLLSGHGYRGLGGMRPATDMPECYDLHGIYQSGFLDDCQGSNPFYNLAPSSYDRRRLKRSLRAEVDPAVIASEIEAGLATPNIAAAYSGDLGQGGVAKPKRAKSAPELAPLAIEDGGVMLYRPLLPFSKDRLIATCLENGIPWFEDPTNADPTLTMRNAVRHMRNNHTLPVALQKPSVLQLADRCRKRVSYLEAEADRLLRRLVVHEFDQNAGTAVITLPQFLLPTAPRRSSSSATAIEKRHAHYRHIAALVVRHVLSMVTPERELTQPPRLAPLVKMLFPSLHPDSTPDDLKPSTICGVLFTPLPPEEGRPSSPQKWLLCRAPHVTNRPAPQLTFNSLPRDKRLGRPPQSWRTQGWMRTQLYDGRFWIRLLHRLPCDVRVAPFAEAHVAPFRNGLGTLVARQEFAALLGKHAPGKARYTLPAIYATADVKALLEGKGWWPASMSVGMRAAPVGLMDGRGEGKDAPAADVGMETEDRLRMDMEERLVMEEGEKKEEKKIRDADLPPMLARQAAWERELFLTERVQLLALPTLGIGLPGLENWVRWDVRYRKIDRELLRLSKLGSKGLRRRELRKRLRRRYRRAVNGD